MPKTKCFTERNPELSFICFDPKIGFWGRPNMEGDVYFDVRKDVPIRVRHNSEGIRDEPFDQSDKGRCLLCVGGSYTWGSGVEQEYLYPKLLSDRLGKRVVNLGQVAFGLDQVCLTVLTKSEAYSPSVVIVEQHPWALHRIINPYVSGGYVRPHFRLDANQQVTLEKVPKHLKHKVVRRMVASYYAYRKDFLEFISGIDLSKSDHPLLDPMFLSWKMGYYDYMYQLAEKIIVILRDYCIQRGIKLLFLIDSLLQYFTEKSKSDLVDYDLPRDRLIRILEKNCVSYLDSKEQLLCHHSDDDPVILSDGHLNEKGNERVALTLEKKLRSLGWAG
jgi:hypothetical protein